MVREMFFLDAGVVVIFLKYLCFISNIPPTHHKALQRTTLEFVHNIELLTLLRTGSGVPTNLFTGLVGIAGLTVSVRNIASQGIYSQFS